MPRYKRRRTTIGKVAIQHAQTLMANIGAGTAPESQVVVLTEAGARSLDGAGFNTTAGRDSDNENNIGDKIMYVNLMIECGARQLGDIEDRTGWLEWAFVCVKESETAVPITQMGVLTLATVCTNMYRNECIFTGQIPIGTDQPVTQTITLKIPKTKQILRVGDEWRFITSFRAVDSAAVSVNAVRLVKSYMYKSYQ